MKKRNIDDAAYFSMKDNREGTVSLYFSPEGKHNIVFFDKNGRDYYHEEYDGLIKDAETAVQEYAQGIRVIA